MNSLFHYPKWEELPLIDLYVDQVLLYVNQVCQPITGEKGLTASMVNNYVKHGYLAKPSKKKYHRQQLARLIAITTLKPVFSIQEIVYTLDQLQSKTSSEELYNAFVAYLNSGKIPDHAIIKSSCDTIKLYQETLSLLNLPSKEKTQ